MEGRAGGWIGSGGTCWRVYWEWRDVLESKKVMSSMPRKLLVENLLPSLWGQLLKTCSNATEVAPWRAPSCSRPQTTTNNGVRDGRSS